MLKRLFILLGLVVFSYSIADAYTVVMKSGKVLTGTLVSESADSIVFKDDKGIQYSLKKSALDLDKMTAANAAPAPPATPAPAKEPAPAAAPKKPAKVYTAADVDALREKYGNIGPSGDAADVGDLSSPAAYYRSLMEGVTKMSSVMNDLGTLMDGMNTDWQLAAGSNRDPVASLKAYKSGKAFTELDKALGTNIADLNSLVSALDTPPKGMEAAPKALTDGMDAIYDYYRAIQQYAGDPPIDQFRGSMTARSETVDKSLSTIQGIPAPRTEEPAPEGNQPQQTPPSTDDSGATEPPPLF